MKNNPGFSRILLATDGSEPAGAALAVTTRLAHASDAKVHVVHVRTLEAEMRTDFDELLDLTVAQLKLAGIAAEGEVATAEPHHAAGAIAGAARRFEADLVVVGSHGRSDLSSLVRHSTSHELLTALDCPLLVVRPERAGAPEGPERVLLAVAGADDVIPATQAAAAAAGVDGSEVLIVHVAQTLVGIQGYAYVEPDEEIQATLATAASMLAEAGVKTTSAVPETGPVARAVAGMADAWDADMIVIGSSRSGDLSSLLLGSVTHDLLRVTERPVLVAGRIRS